MKRLSWIFVLLMPFFITACLDDSDDDDDNPDADSGWSAQNTGVMGEYRMMPTSPTPTLNQITNRELYTCVPISAVSNDDTDSKMLSVHFDQDGVAGKLQATIFINDTTCSSGQISAGDYAEVVSFDHVISSKGDFVFNRVDVTVTGFAKQSMTQAGADALNAANTNAGACGKDDWTATAELSLPDTSVCANTHDAIAGFMWNDAMSQLGGDSMPLVVGTILEGVYTLIGDIFTLALGPEGSRPSSVQTYQVGEGDNYYVFITGAAAFSRY